MCDCLDGVSRTQRRHQTRFSLRGRRKPGGTSPVRSQKFCSDMNTCEYTVFCINHQPAGLNVMSANSLAFLCFSHVMNELLETERAYVEELLCVLEVSARYVKSLKCGSSVDGQI